jgi:hypothetical protein
MDPSWSTQQSFRNERWEEAASIINNNNNDDTNKNCKLFTLTAVV